MAKSVQIRNMPDKLHRALKARAAQAGMTLSEYLLRELKRVAEKPSVEEILERIRNRQPIRDVSGADYVRQAGAERDAQIRARVNDVVRR